jgi:anti-sigma regulatory factor (Ser/Thr protein kinase)
MGPPQSPPTPSDAAHEQGERSRTPMPDGRLTMDGFARWLLSTVPPQPERVPYVRRQAAAVLRLWRLDEVAAEVELLVDELAGNAVRHARTPFSVTLTWDGRTLRGEVTDVNPLPPQPRLATTPDELGGRGLLLVIGMADRWGFEGHSRGKTVWFELYPEAHRA